MVAIECRVFIALGGRRPRHLLEPHDEVEPFLPVALVGPLGHPQGQQVLDPVVDQGVDGAHAALGRGHGARDVLAVPLACLGAGRLACVARFLALVVTEVRPVHRESGDDLAQRPPEASQREIA